MAKKQQVLRNQDADILTQLVEAPDINCVNHTTDPGHTIA